MVRARRVVAGGDGRPGTDEDRSDVAHPLRDHIGPGALQREVLRSDGVGHGRGLADVADEHRTSVQPQGLERQLSRTDGGGRDRQAILDRVQETGVIGDEDRDGVGPVLGLRQEVQGDQLRIGVCIGDHDAFAGACGHVDRHVRGDRPLGFGHPGVARADDAIHGGHGLCAVGQRRDRLRATHAQDPIDADAPRGHEDRGCDASRPRRGGVATISSSTPASFAGTPHMITELASGARPPGMYAPTRSSGVQRRHAVTPGIVWTTRRERRASRWSAWKRRTAAMEASMAWTSAGSAAFAASSISASPTHRPSSVAPSKRSVSSRTASSPRVRTASTIGATSTAPRGGRSAAIQLARSEASTSSHASRRVSVRGATGAVIGSPSRSAR